MAAQKFMVPVSLMICILLASLCGAAENGQFTLPGPGKALNITGRLGKAKMPWTVRLFSEEKETVFLMLSSPGKLDKYDTLHLDKQKHHKTTDEANLKLIQSDDAAMNVDLKIDGKPVYNMPWFLKPKLGLYTGENQRDFSSNKQAALERDQVAVRYPQFPSSLTEPFTIRFENNGDSTSLWVNGRFLTVLPQTEKVITGSIVLTGGNELLGTYETQALQQTLYLPLELNYYSRPDFAPYVQPDKFRFTSAISGLKPSALNIINGMPVFCVDAQKNIDVGLSRWLEEGMDPRDYYDKDGSRYASDGCPESIILQVPRKQYSYAHILCAVEPDPDKIPVITLRVSRFYHRGRGDAYAESTVYLPKSASEPMPANVKKVGEIKAAGSVLGGKETALPVYLVEVPLKLGEIVDLLGEDAAETARRGNRYLDIELTKEVLPAVFHGFSRRKPLGLPSAVHIFGITLESSPVDVQVLSEEHGNVFYAADSPHFDVRLTNLQDKEKNLALTWETTDFYGNKNAKSTAVTVPDRLKKGGVAEVKIPLAQPVLGYFEMILTVKDDAGRELWRQPTSFALLPPDTRKAGSESPYGTWVNPWEGKHAGNEMAFQGPLLKKMGIRHIAPLETMNEYSEKELAPFGLSYSMVPAPRLAKISAIAEWKKQGISAEEIEKRKKDIVDNEMQRVEEFINKNPGVSLGMIFWERHVMDTEQPYPELLGKPKPALTEAGKSSFDDLWENAMAVGEYYRTKYPHIKISFGNSPSGTMIWFMRQGFPKKYIDYFGEELSGVYFPTETQPRRSVFQDVWFVRYMQKLYGYEDIALSSGCENVFRPIGPGGLNSVEQSDFYVRDALHSLAYGFRSINVGGFEDVFDGYYNSFYGKTGFVRRMPLNTPTQAYVAYATLTLVLDSAKYERCLYTGTNSLYVLEFTRGGERIYPIWTLRGKRSLTVTMANGNDAKVMDCMGNISGLTLNNNEAVLEATSSPMYLVTSGKIEQVSAGKSTYDEDFLPLRPVIVNKFNNLSELEIETPDSTFTKSAFYGNNPWYLQGNFRLEAVEDRERGNVLELTMESQPEAPQIAGRYAALRLKEPVTIEKEFRRLGIWVKGNSCWGKVCWEFWDANGERYVSRWDRADFGEHSMAINFDDWCFVSMELPKRYPCGYPGIKDQNWAYVGGDKDGIIQFPIKVMWVAVAMRDWQVYVTDMVPAQSRSIRLGPIVAGN